ncbi:ABC transporter substrate-binding protein [Nocardioides maradonensis]
MKRTIPLLTGLLATGLLTTALSACSVAGASSNADVVVIGYQSKTINTVTAGTLLRELGYFEADLKQIDPNIKVEWQDYDTGAPITAQMLAGKIDIGSMGDYPLLINGSRAGTGADGDSLLSVTGYNAKGALNGVVVGPDSPARTLADLQGRKISASVGSAGHGTLIQALTRLGIDPTTGVTVENQDPPVGASALQAGSVDAVAQFVAWPGVLTFRDNARLVYDGGELDLPTLHGTVVRNAYAKDHPDVVNAFLQAQIQATTYLHEHPVEAAEKVAAATGLPPEVVYLYNGRDGISTFDPTIKPAQVAALKHDVPFLRSIGVLTDPVDVDSFVNPALIKKAVGSAYAKEAARTSNPAAITGTDRACHTTITATPADQATAGEVWVQGEAEPRPVADADCLLRNIAQIQARGGTIRASYVDDTLTGTRWFADHMVWLRRGKDFLPFATQESADTYAKAHAGTTPTTYADAVKAS